MYGYIYKTTDKTNGKIYVGKKVSKSFKGIDYIGSGKIICRIKKKLDEQNIPYSERFGVELIDTAENVNELNSKEIHYIDLFEARNPSIGYNLRKGGDCGPGGDKFKGHKHSEETRKQMSISRMGELNSNFGNHWKQSDELKALHSRLSSGENNGMYGKKHTNESKEKNSKSHIGKIAVSNPITDTVKMITMDKLDEFLSDGWVKGNIHIR